MWHLCYHSMKYPVTSFINMDDEFDINIGHESMGEPSFEEPNANSTFLNRELKSNPGSVRFTPTINASHGNVFSHSYIRNTSGHSLLQDDPEDNVGHMSHIPRKPPTPTTYTIPSFMEKSIVTEQNDEDDLFGMIKLKDNDVCYTSGSIEWVGKKRSYPINSGFKIINESFRQSNEPLLKKVKRLDKTFDITTDKLIKECDCANMLPTVNAIVDHLNALHEAVDLVDLRLNTLEDVTEIK